uniref:Uncharacterized protein n=1 Tax=Caenorhabditis japonica TaxID=281687 RepID=A0A8R1DXW3_CAEJA
MNPSEQSSYLYGQYDEALGEQLKANPSQYVLPDLNKNSSQQNAQVVQKVDSEYLLRDFRNQSKKNPIISRDAPNRPFLTGTPVNAKDNRAQIEYLDNSIVVPQIIDGKVYFTTHGKADARTAVEGSVSNPNLATANASASGTFQPVNLQKVKFSFAQLVRLLGTCQRLERILTAQSVEPNLLSTRTAHSSASVTGKELTDVNTCYEIQSPTVSVTTALGFATPSGNSQSVFTAPTIRSSEDVSTAMEILSSMNKSFQDVRTAVGIDDDKSSMAI